MDNLHLFQYMVSVIRMIEFNEAIFFMHAIILRILRYKENNYVKVLKVLYKSSLQNCAITSLVLLEFRMILLEKGSC